MLRLHRCGIATDGYGLLASIRCPRAMDGAGQPLPRALGPWTKPLRGIGAFC